MHMSTVPSDSAAYAYYVICMYLMYQSLHTLAIMYLSV